MRSLTLLGWCLFIAIPAACGGKVVFDGTADAGGGGATGSTVAASSVVAVGATTGGGAVDPNCDALCSDPAFSCAGGAGSGVLSSAMTTATGCIWQFSENGGPPITLTMDCSSDLPCMFFQGQCFILNWAAPGDTAVPPLGFATPDGVWDCSPLFP